MTGACGEFELNATAGFELREANVHHRPHDVRCAGVRRWMGSQCSWKLQKKACRHLSDLTNTVDSVYSEATFFAVSVDLCLSLGSHRWTPAREVV